MAFLRTTDEQRRDSDELARLAFEFDELRLVDQERVERMVTHRKENLAIRGVQVESDVADMRDYGRRQTAGEPSRHNLKLPFGLALTIKHAHRISGRLPDVVVDRREDTPLERHRSDTMEKIVWAIIRESRGENQLAAGAWDGSQLGAACFDLYYSIGRQMPLFRSVDPAGILVVEGVDDPHDFSRVYRYWEVPIRSLRNDYAEEQFRGEPVKVDAITTHSSEAGIDRALVVQVADKKKRLRFALGGEGSVPVGLYENVHDLGFVPYVVIPNIGPERDVWGISDYELVRALVHYIPALFSREADIIRAVANGAVIEKGTGQSPEVIRRIIRLGGVIPSKKDGAVEPIETPETPAFAEGHAGRSLEFLKMLGFAPDAAWGGGISGSGSDRGLQLQPLMELTALKQTNWEAGLGRLFTMAYKMIEQKLAGTASYRGAVQGQGNRRRSFVVQLGSDLAPIEKANPAANGDPFAEESIFLPRTPKELFDGDHSVRFVWQNRVDPDDPSFVLSELNKFERGAQSLETTLERLGVQSPEDEMRRIEAEAERFPWINQGMVALLKSRLSGGNQGDGGGRPEDTGGALAGALETTQTPDGSALDADAAAAAVPGRAAPLYGGA